MAGGLNSEVAGLLLDAVNDTRGCRRYSAQRRRSHSTPQSSHLCTPAVAISFLLQPLAHIRKLSFFVLSRIGQK